LHLLDNEHPTGDPPLQILHRTLTEDMSPGCHDGKYDPYDRGLLRAFAVFAELMARDDSKSSGLLESYGCHKHIS